MMLFNPGKIGNLSIKNRIVMSAMGNRLAELDGRFSRRSIDYYVARAKGGTGLIITEAVQVHKFDDEPYTPLINYSTPDISRYTDRIRELAKSVHDYGAKIAIQLHAGIGRNASPAQLKSIGAVAPSALPCSLDPNVISRELTIKEVEQIVRSFEFAAEVVANAGIDAIELNCHFGYLVDEFMTALWNRRTDKYGGDLDGRLTFLFEIIESVKKGAGLKFPLIVKYGLTHYLAEGRQIDEGLEIAQRLEKCGIGAIDIDAGCYETSEWIIPPTYKPFGTSVELAGRLKKVIDIPVMNGGKLGQPNLAEKALKEKKADFIVLGRTLLADPEWANKVKAKRLKEICPCIGCLEGCCGNTGFNMPISCTVNPATTMEKRFEVKKTHWRKSVLVIGGGPAGLEAARVAALRGHKVTLWEQGYALGGNLRLSSVPDFKQDYRIFLDYLISQLKKVKVTVCFGKKATPEAVREFRPDSVILATGGIPFYSNIPGKERNNVLKSIDILQMLRGLYKWETMNKRWSWNKVIWFSGNIFARFLKSSTLDKLSKFWLPFGKKVIIIGGGYDGCEMALFLARRGRKVTIIESLGSDNVARDLFIYNRAYLLKLLVSNKVEIMTDTNVLKITDTGVIMANKEGSKNCLKADTIMITVNLKPNIGFLDDLKKCNISEVYYVGDSVEPRRLMGAIQDGFKIARLI